MVGYTEVILKPGVRGALLICPRTAGLVEASYFLYRSRRACSRIFAGRFDFGDRDFFLRCHFIFPFFGNGNAIWKRLSLVPGLARRQPLCVGCLEGPNIFHSTNGSRYVRHS
jgi:hypothetical protein